MHEAMPYGDVCATIIESIQTRRPITAIYDGRERVFCPHVVGLKRGNLQSLCYQSGGQSSSGLEPPGSPANWRCIRVGGLSKVRINPEGEWQTASNHSRPQTCVDEILAEIDY